jgi:hypothetical protein
MAESALEPAADEPGTGEPGAGGPGAGEPGAAGPESAADPVRLLVRALGALPPEERDQVYVWLLARSPTMSPMAGTVRLRGAEMRALVEQRAFGVTFRGTQPAAQQVVPVRFSLEQHAALREWCAEHGFSMATVIRGLVARFLEGQLPERN